ncbi:hypothetical protein GCM10027569_51370 [Flindersiella endophytica]
MIDDYIAGLEAALRGSRRTKADLLTEARDGLTDVADAYYLHGLSRSEAEEQAVAEFGTVAELAPLYQREIGLAQGRRTALLVALTLIIQPILWTYVWDALIVRGNDQRLPFIDLATNYLGSTSIVLALVVAALCGPRGPNVPARLGRAVGVFGFIVAAIFSGLGLVSTLISRDPNLPTAIGPLCLTGFLLVPMALVVLSSRRCLVAG